MKKRDLKEEAMEAWWELASANTKTDIAVNDWLEEVAGDKYFDGPNGIWTTIINLTNSECRRFLTGCQMIDTDVDEWNLARR